MTYEESYRHHSQFLEEMFLPSEVLTERKMIRRYAEEMKKMKIEDVSPTPRNRNSGYSG